jgi:hypothetical protein
MGQLEQPIRGRGGLPQQPVADPARILSPHRGIEFPRIPRGLVDCVEVGDVPIDRVDDIRRIWRIEGLLVRRGDDEQV